MTRSAPARSVRRVDRRRRETAIDLGLCAAMVAYALPPMLDPTVNDPAATVAGPLLLPTLILPVLVRRRHPLAAACALAAGCVISGIPTFNQFRLIVAVPAAMLILYVLATRASRARAVAGFAVILAGLAFVGATDSVLEGVGGVAGMVAFSFPLCFAVWGAGRLVLSRERLARQLTERSGQLHRQREATAALAVEIDRSRLASDLELAARSRLHEMIDLASGQAVDPGDGRARFSRIELLGRESLDEMRSLLGLLRSVDRGARAPRPTLEQLDALLADARAGGRIVELEIEGEHRPLTAGVELAAYRTVQHALVAVAGARDQPATVALRYLPDRLELEIRGPHPAGSAAGAALMAARERVTALGGSFTADTPSPGQQIVRARLPAVPAVA
jgi:signal transduction histidine kinase